MKSLRSLRFSFLVLLPLYFPLHHYVVNYLGVSGDEFLALVTINVVVELILILSWWLLTKNWTLSALLTFPVLLFLLLFSTLQDLLGRLIELTIAFQYLFLVSSLILVLVLMIRWLRKDRESTNRLSWFFNLTIIAWIVIEVINASHINNTVEANDHSPAFLSSSPTESPDIYLLIADEYPRADALHALFGFNNKEFLTQLENRGFDVLDSIKSNYDVTSFSIASMFSLNYLTLTNTTPANSDYSLVSWKIKTAPIWKFLQSQNYKISNYSIFDLAGQPPLKNSYVRDYNYEYFLRSLPGRLYNDLKSGDSGMTDHDYNQHTLSRLLQFNDGGNKNFLYGHLLMPHSPHYLDSAGNLNPRDKLWSRETFIPYLQSTNQKLISVIDHLLTEPGEKMILLLGDHGFRGGNTAPPFYFKNFAAVYSTQRVPMPESLTNINLFRMIMNTAFRQQFPLLEDKQFNIVSSDPLKMREKQ